MKRKQWGKGVDYAKGDVVEFTALRIVKGNPIQGQIINLDRDSIEVKLHKDIQGLVSDWPKGSVRPFRLDLIEKIKVIKKFK